MGARPGLELLRYFYLFFFSASMGTRPSGIVGWVASVAGLPVIITSCMGDKACLINGRNGSHNCGHVETR